MKLTYINIINANHRPLMNGVEITFPPNGQNCIHSNCFIGINGSGKSQLLETIAEIFFYLDLCFRSVNKTKTAGSPALFEIKYILTKNEKEIEVQFSLLDYKQKLPKCEIHQLSDNTIINPTRNLEEYLPSKIVGYTSGDNETLSNPFQSYYDNYAAYVAGKAFGDIDGLDYAPRFYFMDYNTNLGIAISNLVFDSDTSNSELLLPLTMVKTELNIQRIKSFQIIVQTRQSAAPKAKSKTGETGVILTKELNEWLSYLKKSSTCYDYSKKENKYTFDFLLDSASKDALHYFFKNPYNLYTALYKFEILNNLIIDKATRRQIETQRAKRKLTSKMPEVPDKDKVMRYSELKMELTNGQIVEYLSLSDGEHQFFNIFGTILMIDDPNSLFLFDEPETHFNPKWRRLFVSKINSITKGRLQDLFLTSHSPFIVSDTSREFVYIFERVETNKIEVKNPDLETFGASFNHILQMAFGLNDSMSEDSAQFIQELLQSMNPNEIEEGITQLGDSPKIMSLFRRLEMLNNK